MAKKNKSEANLLGFKSEESFWLIVILLPWAIQVWSEKQKAKQLNK